MPRPKARGCRALAHGLSGRRTAAEPAALGTPALINGTARRGQCGLLADTAVRVRVGDSQGGGERVVAVVNHGAQSLDGDETNARLGIVACGHQRAQQRGGVRPTLTLFAVFAGERVQRATANRGVGVRQELEEIVERSLIEHVVDHIYAAENDPHVTVAEATTHCWQGIGPSGDQRPFGDLCPVLDGEVVDVLLE